MSTPENSDLPVADQALRDKWINTNDALSMEEVELLLNHLRTLPCTNKVPGLFVPAIDSILQAMEVHDGDFIMEFEDFGVGNCPPDHPRTNRQRNAKIVYDYLMSPYQGSWHKFVKLFEIASGGKFTIENDMFEYRFKRV